MWYELFNKVIWDKAEKSDAEVHARQVRPDGIKEIRDLSYIDDGTWQHKIDVIYPENKENEKLPVVIDIHGGGWMYATKDLNKFYNYNIANRGFCVFAMSYSLVPDCTPADQLREVMQSLKWIKEHMAEYPCDTSKIMLTGDSAGGMLAAFAAALLSDGQMRDVYKTVNPELSINVLALTCPVAYMNQGGWLGFYTKKMWGKGFKNEPTYHYMNINEVMENAQIPPTFMVTASGDILGHKQTRMAAADFKKKGIEVKLMDWEKVDGKDLPHVFDVLEPTIPPAVKTIDEMCKFFLDHVKDKVESK